MGTSTNQRSPSNIPSWRIFRRTLGANEVPVERQAEEAWKAASKDRGGVLADELCSESIVRAATLAATAREPTKAAAQYEDTLDERQDCGVVYDAARRALVRAVANGKGAEGFAQELFAEAVNYYVSRDLPSFVGARGRVETTTDAIAIKEAMRNIARQVVTPIAYGISDEIRRSGKLERRRWAEIVKDTLNKLQRGGTK